jgi:hypothetical protein
MSLKTVDCDAAELFEPFLKTPGSNSGFWSIVRRYIHLMYLERGVLREDLAAARILKYSGVVR